MIINRSTRQHKVSLSQFLDKVASNLTSELVDKRPLISKPRTSSLPGGSRHARHRSAARRQSHRGVRPRAAVARSADARGETVGVERRPLSGRHVLPIAFTHPDPEVAERAARAIFELEKTRLRHGRELAGTPVEKTEDTSRLRRDARQDMPTKADVERLGQIAKLAIKFWVL